MIVPFDSTVSQTQPDQIRNAELALKYIQPRGDGIIGTPGMKINGICGAVAFSV